MYAFFYFASCSILLLVAETLLRSVGLTVPLLGPHQVPQERVQLFHRRHQGLRQQIDSVRHMTDNRLLIGKLIDIRPGGTAGKQRSRRNLIPDSSRV